MGYLGIDAGTQGLSVVLTDDRLRVVATGESTYGMIPGLDEGCYEQDPTAWWQALCQAVASARETLSDPSDWNVAAIGISGQMHGEVCCDDAGNPLRSARLWCDIRNEEEGEELTELWEVKVPKRMTVARWLWTLRNHPELAAATRHLTTPAGWLAFRLTGTWNLGIGDAAGMFPVDAETLEYRRDLLDIFTEHFGSAELRPLDQLLPTIRRAGEEAGQLSPAAASELGLPAGIPVAAAEGDQPASLAGSLIGRPGTVSVSFGTSVCANSVGDRSFEGVSPAVDHFCAPDGKPINMVWLRNGTTFMNSLIAMFAPLGGEGGNSAFEVLMPRVLTAPPTCGGLLALPFMDDEPGLGIHRGGTAMLLGIHPDNADPANAVKAALLATMFNLRLGSEVLDRQGFPRDELVLSGGLTRTPELGQVLADVFDTPVRLLDSAAEGTAWGSAVLACYRNRVLEGNAPAWTEFLAELVPETETRFVPDPEAVAAYDAVYNRYRSLIEARAAFANALDAAE